MQIQLVAKKLVGKSDGSDGGFPSATFVEEVLLDVKSTDFDSIKGPIGNHILELIDDKCMDEEYAEIKKGEFGGEFHSEFILRVVA